jgi:hypothetical protein
MSRYTCRDCGDLLTEQNRTMKSVSKKGKKYYLNRCKPCIVEADMVLRTLKKQNPHPATGTPCECCGRIDKLFCDHDHATKEFRAWICKNCNSGIGMLGDSEAGLRRALAYLERVRLKSRSRSPCDNKTNDAVESVEVASSRCGNKQQGSENVSTDQ